MRPTACTLLGILLAVSLQAQDPNKPQGPQASQTPARSSQASGALAANDTTYKIGPQDIVRIDVWKEPEISRSGLPVRPDGKISLPLLNDVQAVGLSPQELSNVI